MFKVFSIFLIFTILFIACDKMPTPVEPDQFQRKHKNKISSAFANDNYNFIPKIVRVKDSISINYLMHFPTFNWGKFQTASGKHGIKHQGENLYFVASDSVGMTKLLFSTFSDESEEIDSIHVLVYKQFVILKADDFIYSPTAVVPERWRNFIDYSLENSIESSIGIVGNSLERGNQDYYSYIKEFLESNYFELWNHGYNHIVDSKLPDGSSYSEFKNMSYEYQKNALEKTQSLCNKYLNYKPIVFGAPGNATDSTTIEVINQNSELKIWFYGSKKSDKLVLDRVADIEFPYGNPDYSKFLNNYNAEEKIITLQIHPNMWDLQKFSEFEKIIDFLKSQNVTFITPSEYLFLISPR